VIGRIRNQWHSHATARCWCQVRTTSRCGCGTRQRAPHSRRWKATRAWSHRRHSRRTARCWFSRCWALQELLAPGSVEFFSREYRRLGDKRTLERQIHDITNVAVSALRQSAPLSQFTVDERLSWALHRQTTRKEDKAYSLLGIFNVYTPLICGEGTENAFRRLLEEIDKRSNGKHTTLIHTQYGNEEQAGVEQQFPSIEPSIEGLSGGLPLGDNFSAGRLPDRIRLPFS